MKRRGIEMQDKQDRMRELEQARLAAMPSALPMMPPAVVQPGRNGPKAEQILNRPQPLMPWGQQNNTAMQPRMTPAGSMSPLGARALGGVTLMPNANSGLSYGGFQNGANPEERIFGASGAEREIANAKAGNGGQVPVANPTPMQPMNPQPAQPVYVPGTKANPNAPMGAGQGAGVLKPLPPINKPQPTAPAIDFPGDGVLQGVNRGPYRQEQTNLQRGVPMLELPGRATGGPIVGPFVGNERGPEAQQLPNGQVMPLGNGQPGVFVAQQPVNIIPNNALPPFSPAAQQLLRQPAGMRKTDWKRYLAKGGALDLMQMDQQQAQFNQRMQVEDMRYNRARQDELSDREATKAEKLQMERDEDARSMEMIQALGSDQAILSPADVATLGRIKGAKARAAALDVLMQRRAAEREEQKNAEPPKPWMVESGVPGVQIYGVGRSPMGSTEPPKTQAAPGELLKQLGPDYEIGEMKSDGSFSIRPKRQTLQRPVDIVQPGVGAVSMVQDPKTGEFYPAPVRGQAAPTTTPTTGDPAKDIDSTLSRLMGKKP